MSRNPRSANTLIRELQVVVPDLEVKADDLDGLKVYRTFRLTSTAHKGLEDVVTAVADSRIVNSRAVKDGVEVTFTHLVRADRAAPFGVADAADLLTKKRAKKAVAPKPEPDEDE
jgi:hypothetical protein